MKELKKLFIAFFRIGLLTFGGGYAMLPMLQREVVEKNGWASEEELLNYFAVGQCTPGIIAVNTATFIGRKAKGFAGSVISTFALVMPSLIIITVIAALLSNISHIVWVQKAFWGIRIAVTALIVASVVKMVRTTCKNVLAWILFAASTLLQFTFSVSPVIITISAGLIGIVLGILNDKKTSSDAKGGK